MCLRETILIHFFVIVYAYHIINMHYFRFMNYLRGISILAVIIGLLASTLVGLLVMLWFVVVLFMINVEVELQWVILTSTLISTIFGVVACLRYAKQQPYSHCVLFAMASVLPAIATDAHHFNIEHPYFYLRVALACCIPLTAFATCFRLSRKGTLTN